MKYSNRPNAKLCRSLFFGLSLFTCLISGQKLEAQFQYDVIGPTEIFCTDETFVQYSIYTDLNLVSSFWDMTVVGGGQFIMNQDVYGAQVQFLESGMYILTVTSTDSTGFEISYSLEIYVELSISDPEIIGCYEYDGNVYHVCAFSQSTLIYPDLQGFEVEVVGALGYEFDWTNSTIVITWGAGGSGFVNTYGGPCLGRLQFEIHPHPEVDFSTQFGSADTITVCRDQEIYFENLSINGSGYNWYFGDGEESQNYDASHAYSTEGFYQVILAADGICDCIDADTMVVFVLPDAAPMLECVNSVCPGSRQRYTAQTDGCTNFSWSISSNGTIVNGGGSDEDFIEIIWHSGPDGMIELSVAGCQTSYCNSAAVFRVPVISPDGPVSGDASVCSGEISTYSTPYFDGTEYQWLVGSQGTIINGQNTNAITVRWNNVNSIANSSVTVQYDNCFLECGGTATLPVAITPQLRLTGDIQVCQFTDGEATAQAGFTTYTDVPVNWHIEDAEGNTVYQHSGSTSSLTHNFNYPPGAYYWVATETSGDYCNEIVRMRIDVTSKPATPLGISGADEICPGVPYGYTIESAGSAYTTVWTVTDGVNLTEYRGQTFQHAFGSTPPYIVEARHAHIQYPECLSDMIHLSIDPVTSLEIYGPDEVCFNVIDSFEADFVPGVDYTWEVIPPDHGEIRRSDLNHVEVFWTQSGIATLRLTACGIIADQEVVVLPLPSFNILGPLSGCENELVTLRTDQSALMHIWQNENDQVIGIADTLLAAPGAYAVKLTDTHGCSQEKAIQVNANPAPVVHLSSPFDRFYCNQIPNGIEITANTDGVGYQFVWYRDGIEIGPGGPVYTVTDFGTYHVVVTNAYGCQGISGMVTYFNCCAPNTCGGPGGGSGCIFIQEDLQVEVSPESCERHTYQLNHPDIVPGSVEWTARSVSKGVVAQANSDVFSHSYSDPGYYQIRIIAELSSFSYTGNFCAHWDKYVDTVKAVADFEHTGICAGEQIEFTDLTTFLPDESIASWTWNFDDPSSGGDNTSNLQNPMHVFATPGSYQVELVITMASGCTSIRERQVDISGGPALAPAYEDVYCENEALAFYLPGQVFDIQWNFGDPPSGVQNMAIADSAFHTYDLPGIYTVNVAASDINNCRSDVDVPVDVKSNTMTGIIDVDPGTVLCYGDTATLTAPAGGVEWSWSNNKMTEAIDVIESDQYSVFIRDQFHCSFTPPPVFIEVNTVPEILVSAREIIDIDEYGPWESTLGLCAGLDLEIQVFSGANTNFQWSHGPTTNVLQFTSEAGNLPGAGVHHFYVVGIDATTGCVSDTAQITIEIYAPPSIPLIAITGGSGCGFDENSLEVTNPEPGVQYTWSDGRTGTSIIAEKAGSYSVTGTSPEGCTSESDPVVIKPAVAVDQIPGGCFIECDPLEVCLPSFSQVAYYTIYQNGTIYQSGTTWPDNFLITQDGSYTIEVTSTNGCVAVSDPLDIVLYTGTGTITVITYEDLDGDGVISTGDGVLSNIPVQIQSNDGMHFGQAVTDADGSFHFPDYPATGYLGMIDLSQLSSQWLVLIDSVSAEIETCDDSVVVELLLVKNCTVTGPDQFYEMCPGEQLVLGDSIWNQPGLYEMHLGSQSGCDSVFQVLVTVPDSLTIDGLVWVDVDQNGVISPADSLVSGIPVEILRPADGFIIDLTTDAVGSISVFLSDEEYLVSIDTAALPQGYVPVIYESMVHDTVCGSVLVQFLVAPACSPIFLIDYELLCAGDSILVQGEWINEPGTYSYILGDSVSMCDTMLDVYVDFYEEIIVDGEVDWSCPDLGSIDLTLSGNGPFIIDWLEEFTGDTILQYLDPGSYSVLITDANGCSVSDTFEIIGGGDLFFEVSDEYYLSAGDSVFIEISGDIDQPGLTYQWTPAGIVQCPSCPASWIFPLTDTTLLIRITDQDSCVYTLAVQIYVDEEDPLQDIIYIPNVFSPNGDGSNDKWTIVSREEGTYVNDLALFDRWGNTVFTQEEFLLNAFEGWDGAFQGRKMEPGVFIYKADLTLADGRQVVVYGDVTLVR